LKALILVLEPLEHPFIIEHLDDDRRDLLGELRYLLIFGLARRKERKIYFQVGS